MAIPDISPDAYNPSSPVLFLGICSLSKRKDVESDPSTQYQSDSSIAARLNHRPAVDRLYQGRREGFDLIRESGIENNGALLRDHPYNVARGLYRRDAAGGLHPAAAPRFLDARPAATGAAGGGERR